MENEWAKHGSSYSLNVFITLWATSHQMQTLLRRDKWPPSGRTPDEDQVKTLQLTVAVYLAGCLCFFSSRVVCSAHHSVATTEGDALHIQTLLKTTFLRAFPVEDTDGSLKVGRGKMSFFSPVLTSYLAMIVEAVCVVPTASQPWHRLQQWPLSCMGSWFLAPVACFQVSLSFTYSHEIWQHHFSFSLPVLGRVVSSKQSSIIEHPCILPPSSFFSFWFLQLFKYLYYQFLDEILPVQYT